MKAWLALALVACACVGCASRGGSMPRTSDGSGITMYGTIDQGITFRK
ncbi:MAG: hypothetical protein ACTHKH_13830 [Trinickia sp.]